MTDALDMVSQVRHRIVGRAAQEILAVIEFGKSHFSSLRATSFYLLLPLRKS